MQQISPVVRHIRAKPPASVTDYKLSAEAGTCHTGTGPSNPTINKATLFQRNRRARRTTQAPVQLLPPATRLLPTEERTLDRALESARARTVRVLARHRLQRLHGFQLRGFRDHRDGSFHGWGLHTAHINLLLDRIRARFAATPDSFGARSRVWGRRRRQADTLS